MIKRILILPLLTGLIVACSASTKNENKEVTNSNSIDFESKSYYASSDQGAAISVEIPLAKGESEVAKTINSSVFEGVKNIIGTAPTATDYTILLNSFIADYDNFKKDQPSCSAGWEATVEGTVEKQTAQIINIKLSAYTFTGGAHGNPTTTSFLFDSKTGKELTLTDIVKDIPALTKIAEAKFRKEYEIANDDALTSTGFWFNEDKFVLPANIFLTQEGIQLFYNHYEIAPYAAGTQEVTLPYSEVKDLLSIEL